MHRNIISPLLFLILVFTQFASQANESKKPEDIVIINYGIFAHSPDNGTTWINPVSDKKIKGNSASPVHVKSTRKIPAKFPLFFGFEYQLNNLTDKTTTILTEVSHPAISLADGGTSTGYKEQSKFLILNGKITAINGYLLENQAEAAPGQWTFKIKHKGKTIINQQFEVKAE